MSAIPKDPVMLLSFINLKLRDYYPSFEALCDHEELEPEAIAKTLGGIGYHYDAAANRFV